ncbi:hypothetical protein INR49_010801 [Caranx melampygus]|nr:hypothetical protein INR49_010801 [Caranx melampygus]
MESCNSALFLQRCSLTGKRIDALQRNGPLKSSRKFARADNPKKRCDCDKSVKVKPAPLSPHPVCRQYNSLRRRKCVILKKKKKENT